MDHETIQLAKEWGLGSDFQTGKLSNRVKQQMDYYKAKHRTGMLLKDWSRDNYWQRQSEVLQECHDNIQRVHIDQLSNQDFIANFEKASRPLIITGAADNWPAKHNWKIKVSHSPHSFCAESA